eukprot:NODE_2547_length_547_cov_172.942857_g2497_i0.p1 GENE.NODE_2547_length_547_cov_172.942857_g2497_i0~~NODE_2547_length_547_cov_172.942857_g2497_i0.p1  ORF type:complete len:133 (+),score=33.15 NODE_2547_length_547_cov_172.942857_g2497_i0:74-472(+)
MVKFLKPGRVVLVLQGRQAGHKAVIIQNSEGNKERPYGHVVVAGVQRAPMKVSKRMGVKTIARRSRVKPFIKIVNHNHVMPTRYNIDISDLKGKISLTDSASKKTSMMNAKTAFQARIGKGENKWFFSKLRF